MRLREVSLPRHTELGSGSSRIRETAGEFYVANTEDCHVRLLLGGLAFYAALPFLLLVASWLLLLIKAPSLARPTVLRGQSFL